MLNKHLNKKAQIGETLSLGMATIVIIFLLVIFMVFSSIITAGVPKDIEAKGKMIADKNAGYVSLMAFLNTPVEINMDNVKQKMIMSDLIRLALIDSNYEQFVENEAQNSFKDIFKSYRFSIKDTAIKEGTIMPLKNKVEIQLPLDSAKQAEVILEFSEENAA